MFLVYDKAIDPVDLKSDLVDSTAGACVSFEGWVRNRNSNNEVVSLEYEVYESLAVKEGEKIISEAHGRFEITDIHAVHRRGMLKVGDIAVWIGVTAQHRDHAYDASRYVIDQLKSRLPIWKKEHYRNKNSEWINYGGNTVF